MKTKGLTIYHVPEDYVYQRPYQKIKVGKQSFWDYSVRIKKVVYQISVNVKTGKLELMRDENQGV